MKLPPWLRGLYPQLLVKFTSFAPEVTWTGGTMANQLTNFVKFTILYIPLYFYYFLLTNFNPLCIDNHAMWKMNYDDDQSKAGLSMNLPVFVYARTKTSSKCLSRQWRCRTAFYVVTDLLISSHTERALQGSCFVLTWVCQGLLIIEIVICIHYLTVSSPHAVRPTTSSLHFSINTEILNTSCHKDEKGIKKAVTGLVSVPSSKTLVWLVARWPWDEGTCWLRLVDEWPSYFPALYPSRRNLLSLADLLSSLGH